MKLTQKEVVSLADRILPTIVGRADKKNRLALAGPFTARDMTAQIAVGKLLVASTISRRGAIELGKHAQFTRYAKCVTAWRRFGATSPNSHGRA